MTYTLLEDIKANRGGKVYGKKGETVVMIADHIEVLTVKGKTESFSVHKSKLKKQ